MVRAITYVEELDYYALRNAAQAFFILGRGAEAKALDKLARKANAVLANSFEGSDPRTRYRFKGEPRPNNRPLTWKDMPRTIPGEDS